ncbi:hypothetical protein CQZ94_11350 [Bacillus sp. MYb209]|nr:hypothetical protein CQZ94_11350 [Bacillus sp. MYb209]
MQDFIINLHAALKSLGFKKKKTYISIFDCILQTRIEPINIKKNNLLHNVSHETIHIPDYLSTT